ncbi:MAG: ornithine carbamoyltransferase [Alphaproteobacteria bacterium]|jgi:ornithine carbamoyltransferase|nr:ornithine carbamoyltransferase [Alphaproteobacteria bacterium]MBT4711863.1 ornithine carbamoyltransferase [Alphaproteobacteria bacterium]MBT5859597.1 ornithine carbamoyltransferase [Alphaproteobacteria bacterium]
MSAPKHFLDLDQLGADTLADIIANAARLKAGRGSAGKAAVVPGAPLDGKLLAMIFEKPSTRTRVSFHVAMRKLGGETLVLQGAEMQLGRGETVADTARVLSRYVDGIMVRTTSHESLLDMAEHASVPVINGLTDFSHPCQVMADILTIEEHRGPIAGQILAWCGDGNNMVTSWMHAAAKFGFKLRIACPPELTPSADVLAWANANGAAVEVTTDVTEALADADCVMADTWVSMGDKNADERRGLLQAYQVNAQVMAAAKADAIFMHCLPAHRGEEVTDEVLDGPQSVVWDEAENRVFAQMGILDWCLG